MRRTLDRELPLLDALALLFPDSSRTTLRQILKAGRVRVDGELEKDGKIAVQRGATIEVSQRGVEQALPPEITLLHEDTDVIVLIKATGLLTVATERERDETVQAYLNRYLGETGGRERIHVVHRLDRDTSGVLVFAKTFHARERLKEQFMEHSIDRLYVAIVAGTLDPEEGTFASWLLERKDLKMISVREGHPESKYAVTHYRTIDSGAKYSMLEVTLETGRKNQIRAHLSEARHPVIGDRMYGGEEVDNPIGRLGLHAKFLGFTHPSTGKRLVFTAPIPRAFRELKL